jgi:hypothetical protein
MIVYNQEKIIMIKIKNREIGTKKNKSGIPLVVLDLETKQSYEHKSIAEAARFFNTHPKTIWRIVYNNKLYLNRYQITEINNKERGMLSLLKLNTNTCIYFNYILKIIKSKLYIDHLFLFILLGAIVCIFMLFVIVLYKEIYDQYVFTLREGKVNYYKCLLEHKILLNDSLNKHKPGLITNKPVFIDLKWRYEYIFNAKWTSIHKAENGLGIYQSIINTLNLDFKGAGTFSGINSYYSSPIIERVNINSIFSNAIASTNTANETLNSLGIHGINYGGNINFVVENGLMNRLKTTELLNYQSNILYCLINGLSPSIY